MFLLVIGILVVLFTLVATSVGIFFAVKKKFPLWAALVGGGVLGLLGFVFIACGGLMMIGQNASTRFDKISRDMQAEMDKEAARDKLAGTPKKRRVTWDELREIIPRGMSQDDVIKVCGKPQSTADVAGTQIWIYNALCPIEVYDPVTNKTDREFWVWVDFTKHVEKLTPPD